MARKVFYSFHYHPDNVRAAQVRNMGVIEGNAVATDNEWESVTNGGEAAIKRWIDSQLEGKSCAVVLVGADTARRKWIDYEIKTAWNAGKGVVGVHIHRLRDFAGLQSKQGANPFAHFSMDRDGSSLSSIVRCYNPPFTDSRQCYAFIEANLATWIEEAVSIRENYG
ncbi:TIR domain-containing protein [Botrimarina colliarenosi]|uniref:TIR domain-containing protein n=1 Tax=Botrimarina colliarenosi TaxID=2528001 RepID=UPI0011B40678|nr:TIR domain-containing protein [Botrimarina colliarenosi]